MADVIQADTQHDFWRSPTVLTPLTELAIPASPRDMTEACVCGTEFMIGARFCHTCGSRRPAIAESRNDAAVMASLWARAVDRTRTGAGSVAAFWRKFSFPIWLQYLHFHEIKRWVGLPTGSLITFIIGLGCVVGAIGVSLFYKASNLAEFQAIQMWRIEWLLGATASFVAGILLKTSDRDNR